MLILPQCGSERLRSPLMGQKLQWMVALKAINSTLRSLLPSIAQRLRAL